MHHTQNGSLVLLRAPCCVSRQSPGLSTRPVSCVCCGAAGLRVMCWTSLATLCRPSLQHSWPLSDTAPIARPRKPPRPPPLAQTCTTVRPLNPQTPPSIPFPPYLCLTLICACVCMCVVDLASPPTASPTRRPSTEGEGSFSLLAQLSASLSRTLAALTPTRAPQVDPDVAGQHQRSQDASQPLCLLRL